MEIRNLTCIGCPMGCPLTVKLEDTEVINIEGNICRIWKKRGYESDQNCDDDRSCKRWGRNCCFCQNKRRYSERPNFYLYSCNERNYCTGTCTYRRCGFA